MLALAIGLFSIFAIIGMGLTLVLAVGLLYALGGAMRDKWVVRQYEKDRWRRT